MRYRIGYNGQCFQSYTTKYMLLEHFLSLNAAASPLQFDIEYIRLVDWVSTTSACLCASVRVCVCHWCMIHGRKYCVLRASKQTETRSTFIEIFLCISLMPCAHNAKSARKIEIKKKDSFYVYYMYAECVYSQWDVKPKKSRKSLKNVYHTSFSMNAIPRTRT